MSKSVLDKDGLLYLWNKIKALTSSKVDKVNGKGLSANDFTDADKSKLDSLTTTPSWNDISDKPDLSSVYKYKGSVATTAQLPGGNATAGDVWNVESTGMNYAWTGTGWDALGSVFELTSITNAEIDSITSAGS